MTGPQDPYFQPAQYPAAQAATQAQPPRRRSVVDIVVTCIMSLLACVAAVGSLWFSMFFGFTTDSCGTGPGAECNEDMLGRAYLITWGGVGLAAFIGARALSSRPCVNE